MSIVFLCALREESHKTTGSEHIMSCTFSKKQCLSFLANPSSVWPLLSQLWLDQRLADTFLSTTTSPQALPPALTSSDKHYFL